MSYQIVAFGDSNTRYYLGDTGTPGPLEDAWPAKLEGLLRAQGADVQVENQGYPGVQADFAMEKFASVTAGADLCILGFGTNDAKKLEVPLGEFLSEISAVLDQAAEAGLPLILLGIPWFSQEVAGAGAPGPAAGVERIPLQPVRPAGHPLCGPLYPLPG